MTSMQRDTRTAILDAAQELIQTHGANGMSYQSISRVVKIRKASIHYHFPSKDKLIEEVIRRYSGEFLGLVDGILVSSDSAPGKLRRYIGLFETTLRSGAGRRVCLCGMLGAELASLGNPAVLLLRRFYRGNAKRLARILEDGRKTRTLSFDGDPETMGELIFSFLEGAMPVARADGGVKGFGRLTGQLLRNLGV